MAKVQPRSPDVVEKRAKKLQNANQSNVSPRMDSFTSYQNTDVLVLKMLRYEQLNLTNQIVAQIRKQSSKKKLQTLDKNSVQLKKFLIMSIA